MTETLLWQRDCPADGYVVMETDGNDTFFTCYIEEEDGLTRIEDGLLALYKFGQIGEDIVQCDGGSAPITLSILDPSHTEWHQDGGLRILEETIIYSEVPATAIIESIVASEEFTFEVWFFYEGVASGSSLSRFLTLSASASARNFTIIQRENSFQFRVRTTTTDNNGRPFLEAGPDFIMPGMIHLVCTMNINGVFKVYANNVERLSSQMTGDLVAWDSSYQLGLANEFAISRAWKNGTYELVAIYNRALSSEEVLVNYEAGPRPDNLALTFEQAIISAGDAHQVIEFNPGAALQKAIFSEGLVPNSGEFEFVHNGITYIAQRSERLDTGIVRVYYAVSGEFDKVQYVTK